MPRPYRIEWFFELANTRLKLAWRVLQKINLLDFSLSLIPFPLKVSVKGNPYFTKYFKCLNDGNGHFYGISGV